MTEISHENLSLRDIFSESSKLIKVGKDAGVTIATAESCTGGLIGAAITAIDGSSAIFKGGVIAYANEVKVESLGVSHEDLKAYGAVSESVCLDMAKGVLSRLSVDVAVSVTGIAGPNGGTKDKPVGTVWMGLAWHEDSHVKTSAHLYNFGNIGRNKVRDMTCYKALIQLQKVISNLQSSKA